ncbi:hypothetical protein Tco_0438618, partial [Tanacetum coccineum]
IMVKTNLKSYTPPPTRKSSRIAASISPECNKSQEKSISIHTSENDQEDEQQEKGEEVMSQNTSNRKKICAKKIKLRVKESLLQILKTMNKLADQKNKLNDALVFVDVVKLKGKKVAEKLVSSKKAKQVAVESELVPVDNEKEGCKYDPVKINTRMSPSHLKNVLNTCTLTQIMDLNEMGLGHFHNNFNFESTPGELGMWVVKSYDHETHTLRMGDGRRIKVSRELIHDILCVPMGENKVISLPNTISKSDEQPEEQGEDVVSLKRTSNRKKTCASKKKITFETSEDADKEEGNNTNKKRERMIKEVDQIKKGKRVKKLDNRVIANEEVKENEESEKYEDKSPQKKKRKGKKAELEEGDKDASESNEEPPLRKKKFDAPSFVDVRKLKGDMLVLKGSKTSSKKEPVGDNRKKDNVKEKKETVKKKVVAAGKQVSVKKGKQKINEGTLVSLKEGKKDKDQGQIMVVEKGKEVVVNEKVKCDPVNILSRMSPSHLKNVLESLTTQQEP